MLLYKNNKKAHIRRQIQSHKTKQNKYNNQHKQSTTIICISDKQESDYKIFPRKQFAILPKLLKMNCLMSLTTNSKKNLTFHYQPQYQHQHRYQTLQQKMFLPILQDHHYLRYQQYLPYRRNLKMMNLSSSQNYCLILHNLLFLHDRHFHHQNQRLSYYQNLNLKLQSQYHKYWDNKCFGYLPDYHKDFHLDYRVGFHLDSHLGFHADFHPDCHVGFLDYHVDFHLGFRVDFRIDYHLDYHTDFLLGFHIDFHIGFRLGDHIDFLPDFHNQAEECYNLLCYCFFLLNFRPLKKFQRTGSHLQDFLQQMPIQTMQG